MQGNYPLLPARLYNILLCCDVQFFADNLLWCVVLCCAVLYCAVLYFTVLMCYSVVQHSTLLHCTVQ